MKYTISVDANLYFIAVGPLTQTFDAFDKIDLHLSFSGLCNSSRHNSIKTRARDTTNRVYVDAK